MSDPVFVVSYLMFWGSVAYLVGASVRTIVSYLTNKRKDK